MQKKLLDLLFIGINPDIKGLKYLIKAIKSIYGEKISIEKNMVNTKKSGLHIKLLISIL